MRRIQLVIALLLIAPLVFAWQHKEFNWTPPTEYVDGSPLQDSEIAEYRIYCNGALLGTVENSGATSTWRSPDGSLPPGDYSCYATTVVTSGEESEASNTINFTVEQSGPNPPSEFSVTFP